MTWTGPVSRHDLLRTGALVGAGGVLAACSTPSTPAGQGGGGSATTAAASPSTTSGGFALDGATTAKLDALFDQSLKASVIAGLAAGVWSGSTAWRRSGGYGSLEQKTPYAPGDFVRIASITKSYTSTATLQLVDSGAFSLADPIERFVPGLPNGSTITIKDLLGMTSGLFDFTADDAFLAKFDADPTMAWSFADTLAIVKAHPPQFAPGTQLQYCDANYSVLGEVIAKVAGKPAGAVITESVVDKLGLKSTSYRPATGSRPRTPPGTCRRGLPRRTSTTRSTTPPSRPRSSTTSTRPSLRRRAR